MGESSKLRLGRGSRYLLSRRFGRDPPKGEAQQDHPSSRHSTSTKTTDAHELEQLEPEPFEIKGCSCRLSRSFTGRQRELKIIATALVPRDDGLPATCIIHGMPGIGKTQLTLKYVSMKSDTEAFDNVFYVSATTPRGAEDGFAAIVDTLRPIHHARDPQIKLELSKALLESTASGLGVWLLIVDDVTEESIETVSRLLPRTSRNGNIVFTVTSIKSAQAMANLYKSLGTYLAVTSLTEYDAFKLFARLIGRKQEKMSALDQQCMRELLRSVSNHPLAIENIAFWISQQNLTPEAALESANTNGLMEGLMTGFSPPYPEGPSAVTAFDGCFILLKTISLQAYHLLSFLSFFDPQEIDTFILVKGVESFIGTSEDQAGMQVEPLDESEELNTVREIFTNQTELTKSIEALMRLSLVSVDREKGHPIIIQISALVQEVTLARLNTQDGKATLWLQIVIRIVRHAAWCRPHHKAQLNEPFFIEFPRHVETLNKRATVLGVSNLELWNANIAIAAQFLDRHCYKDALAWATRAAETLNKLAGAEQRQITLAMSIMADSYNGMGQLREAETLWLQVLETREKTLGYEHYLTADALMQLARNYLEQDRLEESKVMGERAVKICEQVRGEDHSQTQTIRLNICSIYMNLNMLDQAEELAVSAIDWSKQQGRLDSPQTLTAIANLSQIRKMKGQNDNMLIKELVDTAKRVHGPDHPNTLQYEMALWECARQEGRYAEAETTILHIWESHKRLFGFTHRTTIYSMFCVAESLKDCGRLKDAVDLVKEAVSWTELGRDGPNPHDLQYLIDARDRYLLAFQKSLQSGL